MAQINQKQCSDQSLNAWDVSHSRSFSHPTYIANNCLPPLSPLPPSESSNSNMKNISIDEIVGSSSGYAPALISPRENSFRGNSGLPPRRGHRRCNSDVPLGFSAMIQSSPQLVPISSQEILGGSMSVGVNLGNDKLVGVKKRGVDEFSYGKNYVETTGERKLNGEDADGFFDLLINMDHVDGLKSSDANDKEKDSVNSATNLSCGDSSNTESGAVLTCVTSSREVIRSAAGDVSPQFRPSRSLSMDSSIEKFHFGDSSTKLQTSPSNWPDQLSPKDSLNKNSARIKLEFGHGEFSEAELKRIMADVRLAEVAMLDPKRAKRILANRQSAARSKERKLRYIFELEHKVQTLQSQATTLAAQITILQKDHTELTIQNNEMKFRIEAMQQQAQLHDALHGTLVAEVQRLKLANMVLKDTEQHAPMTHQILPMQEQHRNKMQQLSVTATNTPTTA